MEKLPMRELVYMVATSIDGNIARSDGDYSPLLVQGDSLQAIIDRYPETLPAQAREALGIASPPQVFDTVIMGSNTYQVPGGLPSPYPHLRQVVVSNSLHSAPDAVEIIAGDPLPRVRAMKEEAGRAIWLCGGATLAAQLLPEIDRIILKVSPVVLGTGLPMFRGFNEPVAFEKPRVEVFNNGVVFQTYQRKSA